MQTLGLMARTLNNRAVQYSRSDNFTLVNLTVALFALNCFLLTASQLVPSMASHSPLIQTWNTTAAPMLVMAVAIVAFIVECGWKSAFYRPIQAVLRFVMLTFVLSFIVFMQNFLGTIA